MEVPIVCDVLGVFCFFCIQIFMWDITYIILYFYCKNTFFVRRTDRCCMCDAAYIPATIANGLNAIFVESPKAIEEIFNHSKTIILLFIHYSFLSIKWVCMRKCRAEVRFMAIMRAFRGNQGSVLVKLWPSWHYSSDDGVDGVIGDGRKYQGLHGVLDIIDACE